MILHDDLADCLEKQMCVEEDVKVIFIDRLISICSENGKVLLETFLTLLRKKL